MYLKDIFLNGNSLLSGTGGIDQYIQTIFSKMMAPEVGEIRDLQSTPLLHDPFAAYPRKAFEQNAAYFGKAKKMGEKKTQG